MPALRPTAMAASKLDSRTKHFRCTRALTAKRTKAAVAQCYA